MRKRARITAKSKVVVLRASAECYAAVIDGKVTMKIGWGDFSPNNTKVDGHAWERTCNGRNFAVWVRHCAALLWAYALTPARADCDRPCPPVGKEAGSSRPLGGGDGAIVRVNGRLSTLSDGPFHTSSPSQKARARPWRAARGGKDRPGRLTRQFARV